MIANQRSISLRPIGRPGLHGVPAGQIRNPNLQSANDRRSGSFLHTSRYRVAMGIGGETRRIAWVFVLFWPLCLGQKAWQKYGIGKSKEGYCRRNSRLRLDWRISAISVPMLAEG